MENVEQPVEVKETKVQILKVEKLSKLFDGLTERSIKSVVALKSGTDPLVHLLAVPHPLVGKMEAILSLLDVKVDFVEVVEGDFGELQQNV